jgi:GntR family transcriptional regulator
MTESPEVILDGSAPIPRQIEGQIRRLVLSGDLRPGEELPTVRAMAVGLAVSPHLVEEVYDRLERDGFVTRAGQSGARIALPPCGARDAGLEQLCHDFLRRAAEHGHSLAEVLHAVCACIEQESSHEQAH